MTSVKRMRDNIYHFLCLCLSIRSNYAYKTYSNRDESGNCAYAGYNDIVLSLYSHTDCCKLVQKFIHSHAQPTLNKNNLNVQPKKKIERL